MSRGYLYVKINFSEMVSWQLGRYEVIIQQRNSDSMADVAPSTCFEEVVGIEPVITDGASGAVTDVLPSTKFETVTSVESIDIC